MPLKDAAPPLEPTMAMQRLALHDKLVHSVAQVTSQQEPQGDLVKVKPDKVRRPGLKKGISEDKFLHYQRHWVRYKRATGLADEESIRDQLLLSCSQELADDMENVYGEQLEEKDGQMRMTIPKAHPMVRVQVQMNKDM